MRRKLQIYDSNLRPMQKRFYSLLGDELPKPAHPKLIQIYNYPLAAIINQLLFWHGMGKRKDGYIFKTSSDFKREIGLSEAQQRRAITKGKAFGFLDVTRKGVPAKRHYKLDYQVLVKMTILEAKRQNIELTESWHKLSEKHLTNTESTPENTALNNNVSSVAEIIKWNDVK